jgi:hypothetical protein
MIKSRCYLDRSGGTSLLAPSAKIPPVQSRFCRVALQPAGQTARTGGHFQNLTKLKISCTWNFASRGVRPFRLMSECAIMHMRQISGKQTNRHLNPGFDTARVLSVALE